MVWGVGTGIFLVESFRVRFVNAGGDEGYF